MTYREKYAETISSFTKDQLLREKRMEEDLISLFEHRLETCSNEKKVHDARVGVKRSRICLDEIRKKLGK